MGDRGVIEESEKGESRGEVLKRGKEWSVLERALLDLKSVEESLMKEARIDC